MTSRGDALVLPGKMVQTYSVNTVGSATRYLTGGRMEKKNGKKESDILSDCRIESAWSRRISSVKE